MGEVLMGVEAEEGSENQIMNEKVGEMFNC